MQIAGPTAAFATIVAGIVAENGMSGLATATILAGIILIVMGLLRFGSLIKFIPYTITVGFTAGIAVTIVIGQLKDFFGITYAQGTQAVETMEKLKADVAFAGTVNWQAVIVGVVCLAVLIVWPKISEKIPGSLIAVIVGIVMVKGIGMHVNTIGDLYTISNALPKHVMPDFSLETVGRMLPDAFTIAILAAIESLLSCVVADGMVNSRHRSNMELVAQGAGNIGSALFGGIPATGAIARTAANIKNGGRTPVAGMVHAIVLLLVLVVLMPYAALIPMPTIAAILALTVIFDLVVAIEIGMILACLLLLRRMSEESEVKSWKYIEDENDPDSIMLRKVPKHVRVYEISGPMFFGAADRIATISVKDFTRCLVIRMRAVNALDATAMHSLEELYDKLSKKHIAVVFSHVNEQPMHVMQKAGFVEKVGSENFCAHIDEALERAAGFDSND